jgi:hypothetical protein
MSKRELMRVFGKTIVDFIAFMDLIKPARKV